MSWLYITEEGAHLSRKGGHYIISREHEKICEVPAALVEGAVLIDSVQISSTVIVDFLRRGIPLTWLSSRGQFFGRLESTSHQDIFKQQMQFELRGDLPFCMNLSKMIIFDKIYNQITILRRYNRIRRLPSVESAVRNIRASADRLHQAETPEEIMGYEGIAAKFYFYALGEMLPEEFQFKKRSRQPPKDPFNSMLSFGYTLMMYDFYTAIRNLGLHPYVGFLHALKNGHPALASDLMEPWRPALIDSICMAMVLKGEIKKEHFEAADDGQGVYLNRIGRRLLIQKYEKKMSSVNRYFQGSYSWRHTIMMQCESFRQSMTEKNVELFKPLVIR